MAKNHQQDNKTLRTTIASLSQEVLRLQTELGKAHCTDVNGLRRAYKSLCQHVEALVQESKHIDSEIKAIDTELITADDVATEVGLLGVVSGVVCALHKVTRGSQVKLVPFSWMLGFGVLVVSCHSVCTVGGRLLAMLAENSSKKHKLLQDWKLVEERIAVLGSLLPDSSAS